MTGNNERITVEHMDSVDSTNAELKRRIANGALTGRAALAAAEQTAGRGRRGRTWLNTYGALMLSYAFPVEGLDPDNIPLVTMAAALAACSAVGKFVSAAVIKWPNDIVVRDENGYKKLCGILSELASSPDGKLFAVIGIGINANCDTLPGDLLQPASSILIETGGKVDLSALENALLSALEDETEALLTDPKALLARYAELCVTIGSPVEATGIDSMVVTGRAKGLDERGRLLIETDGRTVTVGAADVSIRNAED